MVGAAAGSENDDGDGLAAAPKPLKALDDREPVPANEKAGLGTPPVIEKLLPPLVLPLPPPFEGGVPAPPKLSAGVPNAGEVPAPPPAAALSGGVAAPWLLKENAGLLEPPLPPKEKEPKLLPPAPPPANDGGDADDADADEDAGDPNCATPGGSPTAGKGDTFALNAEVPGDDENAGDDSDAALACCGGLDAEIDAVVEAGLPQPNPLNEKLPPDDCGGEDIPIAAIAPNKPDELDALLVGCCCAGGDDDAATESVLSALAAAKASVSAEGMGCQLAAGFSSTELGSAWSESWARKMVT